MSDEESVLKVALPPATDYLTYLTILEYNLDKDELPILHDVLQDETLVTNIGWDLVHLLVPMLPESKSCLEDIAILGNPREVVIKVTEELENLLSLPDASGLEAIAEEADEIRDETTDFPEEDVEDSQPDPFQIAATAFETLLHMLCILHPRIKTKRPSRFLEASVSAILRSYEAIATSPVATRALLMFLKSISGSKRPPLPPRAGEPVIPTVTAHEPAPDPEADESGAEAGEDMIQLQWLRFLLTSTIRLHLTQLDGKNHAPLAWSERFVAKEHPQSMLSGRRELMSTFENSDHFRSRELLVYQVLNVAITDLQLDWSTMLELARSERDASVLEDRGESPAVATDGLVCLMSIYLARQAATASAKGRNLPIEDHERLISKILVAGDGIDGSQISLAVWDAILRTAWATTSSFNGSSIPLEDLNFERYVSLLASPVATGPSQGNISLNAATLSTHIVQMHPSSSTRLSCTLSQILKTASPSEKLLGLRWLQNEYVLLLQSDIEEARAGQNVFAQVRTLEELSIRVFCLGSSLKQSSVLDNQEYLLGVLNLLYFLCSSKILCDYLEVARIFRDEGVATRFLQELENAMLSEETERHIDDDEVVGDSLLKFNLKKARRAIEELPVAS